MNEKNKKIWITKKIFSLILALAMIITIMPLESVLVHAAEHSSGTVSSADLKVGDIMNSGVTFEYASGHSSVFCETCKIISICDDVPATTSYSIKSAWLAGAHVGHEVYKDLSAATMTAAISRVGKVLVVYANGTTLPTHEHDWEYSLEGTDTIKAHCKTDGHDGDDVTLTLSASNTDYSGNPVSATLTGADAWEDIFGSVPDIIYSGRGNTTYNSADAPKEIGTYTASISAGDPAVTAAVDFEITKPLSQIKEEAKAEIDKAVGTDTSENVKKAADAAKAAIDAATTLAEVEKAKTEGIAAIQAAIKANAEAVSATTKDENKKDTSYKTSAKKSKITVPKTIKKGGVTYTVTSLKKNAFNDKYVKKVTLPATIKKINSKAFSGDNKLRTLKITSKKITVSKTAFKGIKKSNLKKIKVTVSKKMSKKNFNSLKKNLVKQGLKKKNIVRK